MKEDLNTKIEAEFAPFAPRCVRLRASGSE
jgi:hypothetical protein